MTLKGKTGKGQLPLSERKGNTDEVPERKGTLHGIPRASNPKNRACAALLQSNNKNGVKDDSRKGCFFSFTGLRIGGGLATQGSPSGPTAVLHCQRHVTRRTHKMVCNWFVRHWVPYMRHPHPKTLPIPEIEQFLPE